MPLDHNALAKMAKEEAYDPVEIKEDPTSTRASHSSAPPTHSAPWEVLLSLMREQQKSLKQLTTLVCRLADHAGVDAFPFLDPEVPSATEPEIQVEEQEVEADFQGDPREAGKESAGNQEAQPQTNEQQDLGLEQVVSPTAAAAGEHQEVELKRVDAVVDQLLAAHKEVEKQEKEKLADMRAEEERIARENEARERARIEAEAKERAARLAAEAAEAERLAREAEEQERARIEEEERLAALEAKQAEEEEQVLQEQLAQQEAAAAAAAKALAEAAEKVAAATARKIAAEQLRADKKRTADGLAIQSKVSGVKQEQVQVIPPPATPLSGSNLSVAAATPTPQPASASSTPATAPPMQSPTIILHTGERITAERISVGGRFKVLAHRSESSKFPASPPQKKQVRFSLAKKNAATTSTTPINVSEEDSSEEEGDDSDKFNKSTSSSDEEEDEPADETRADSDSTE